MTEDNGRKHNIVDQPIINSPFEEPVEHWVFDEGLPRREHGRRKAGYWRTRSESASKVAVISEEFIDLSEVNKIRGRVKQWRMDGYPGASSVTLELLRLWRHPEREIRLFFCQLEAAETIIWLTEANAPLMQGIHIPKDIPNDPTSIEANYDSLRRYCCKMATGSGKTVLMGMLIAWSVLNKLDNKQDKRFSDNILVVCPNLTVKERLSVLKPNNPNNYYEKFDLVPRSHLPLLSTGKITITNWHLFQPLDDDSTRSIVKRGPESGRAFCRRIMGDSQPKQNILVINDEAHHAYRPIQSNSSDRLTDLMDEEEYEEATVWVDGLDRINATLGINFCLDMSATPYYIRGSGPDKGSPFPWIVSDFGLVDAIECGIVKIPKVPVDTNSGRPIPEYFELWKWIMEKLRWSERGTRKRRPKPEAVLQRADGALSTLSSEWKKTFDSRKWKDYPVPPVMIIVCADTNLSELIAEKISDGRILPDFRNENEFEVTLRIDSKLLSEAESRIEETKRDQAAILRERISTVGKEGRLGEKIRCVISVSMLNEGWDAQNVTQILGLRAFTSQLLCEQVVGRGLRRMNYDDFSMPEYVDVYGIPFQVIPVAKSTVDKRTQIPLGTKVVALPERKSLEIRFPRVEGYIFDVRYKIVADVKSIPSINILPTREPTEIIVKDAVGYKLGRPDRLGPGVETFHNRDQFYANHRLQTTIYEISRDVVDILKHDARRLLFPQVVEIVREYVKTRVKVRPEVRKEEIALQPYRGEIIRLVSESIRPDTESGEIPILPVIERYRPTGSSSEVSFRSFKECYGTKKSHVSHVVADSNWEHSVMYQLEKMPEVVTYVKNDHLNFEIPYEFEGTMHYFRPDYIVKLQKKDSSVLNIILEVKGFEREKDRAKKPAVKRWVNAINHHGEFGKWLFAECRDPNKIIKILENLS